MTANQIAYQQLLEMQRSNRVREDIQNYDAVTRRKKFALDATAFATGLVQHKVDRAVNVVEGRKKTAAQIIGKAVKFN